MSVSLVKFWTASLFSPVENPVSVTTFRRLDLTRKNVSTLYNSWSILSGFK